MDKIYDTIVIGGGTAGMTAALYAERSGKEILIIERAFFGGQIIATSEIENYPGFKTTTGYTFATELHQQISSLGVAQVADEVVGLERDALRDCWCVLCKKAPYWAKTVILAVGTKNRSLGLPEEEKYLGHGLSYCATCDGAFYKNKRTAVVGGGNTALEEALYLSLLCETVYLIHRRDRFTGDFSLQQRIAKTENIRLLLNTQVTGLQGGSRLEKLQLRSADGREHLLDLDGLFIAIGQIPQNQSFAPIVDLDAHGYIVAGEDCHTSAEGVFAAGDCRTKSLRQLVTAASDGAAAATEAVRYLK